MTLIRYLIVDDEELARTLLSNYAGRLDYLENVGTCKNPLEAMNILREHPVDLIFLDIQMPELTGVEFLRSLKQRPLVIFTTAYPEYALEGYELDVVDYLLKPFSFERFFQAIQKVEGRLLAKNTREVPAQKPAEKQDDSVISIKADHKVHRIVLSEIRYIQSMKEYVAFYIEKHGRILSLGSLKKLEQTLPPDKFIRVHKSYIVPIDRVRSLEGNRLIVDDEKIPLGAHYKDKVVPVLFPSGK